MNELKYNIVMFAYNEQDNIETSITSVFNSTNEYLHRFYVIANGCTDSTVSVAEGVKQKLNFEKLTVHEIELGDKCNAWNTYVHQVADEVAVHFFVDADVRFSMNCFPQMAEKLHSSPEQTVIIAGMPLSGRNLAFYRSLVIERSCFFGNLYGMKWSFIQRIREKSFYLPVGLNWIDSFLTKAANTDLAFDKKNLPDRTTWLEGVGYDFEKLSVLKPGDIKLYINRIARYELGKIQEVFLDALPPEEWPRKMKPINQKIDANFSDVTSHLNPIKRRLVRQRLTKLLLK
ncbi:glycosyltransferase family 2 protein [Alteromonas sp. ZYF713]|nr:glycosyltransferase family 2 protein [Alteromonas sp. ZYF713]